MLLNLRFGLATNSSSTHSIIWMPEHGATDGQVDSEEFGWNFWTAASKESKLKYAGHLLASAWSRIVSPDIARGIVRDWLGVDIDLDADWSGGYIDHQSRIEIPLEFGGKTPSKQFAEEFAAYLAKEEVVILGGNDNDDKDHPLLSDEVDIHVRRVMPVDTYRSMMVCRKDPKHGYWTLFDPASGVKWRFHFNGKDIGEVPDKSSTPELVDIKITDQCTYGCYFCYQDSTIEGKHASRKLLDSLKYVLRDLKVFEVALGGGEPTLHPDFWDLIEGFRSVGIVPNFTTRNTRWLRNPDKVARFRKGYGDFAFSIQHPEEIDDVAELADRAGVKDRLSFQIVMGTMTRETFKSILEKASKARRRITLLGYKTAGRGHKFRPIDYSWWLDVCAEMANKLPRLGIDTALADQYEENLKAAEIPEWLWSKHEGRHSMYVDAVEGKMGPSSYVEEKDMVDLPSVSGYYRKAREKQQQEIVEIFERW